MPRVVVAMSGGVDSSVAAALLKERGWDVVGLFMRHGEATASACAIPSASASGGLPILGAPKSHKQGCCSASDAEDARRVADKLDVPFYAADFREEFGRIMDYFVDEYAHARTPNPCIMCNAWLKFGRLWEYAESVQADAIATGHYARLEHGPDGPRLLRGLDRGKDQAYALFGIDRRILPKLLFPVGEFEKPRIRELAAGLGLRVADKKDSQEICFVPDGDHASFVRRRLGERDTSGEFVTVAGEVVGRHRGIEAFTVGQRKGLGIALGTPHFVVRIEPETNRVVLGQREDLARTEFFARRTNWLVEPPRAPLRCEVKIRYLSELTPATVEPLADDRVRVILDRPQYGVAPGQAAVCYDGDRVLGGGWIE